MKAKLLYAAKELAICTLVGLAIGMGFALGF
jgi:hypothetical protein